MVSSMFAYSSSDMESTVTIINIALVVMGVLQLILFFKIWGMTNDVRELKDKFCTRRLGKEQLAKKMIEMKYMGKVDEAKKILDENLENEVFNQLLVQEVSLEFIKVEVEKVINKYEQYYELLNCEIPNEIKEINVEKVFGDYSSL